MCRLAVQRDCLVLGSDDSVYSMYLSVFYFSVESIEYIFVGVSSLYERSKIVFASKKSPKLRVFRRETVRKMEMSLREGTIIRRKEEAKVPYSIDW